MTDAPVTAQPERFKAPLTDGALLRPGDRFTCVVLGPGDDKSETLKSIYNKDIVIVSYDPAPPPIEPKCEVEVDTGDEKPLVGTVIAVHNDLVWIEGRIGGNAIYPKHAVSVIRSPKR